MRLIGLREHPFLPLDLRERRQRRTFTDARDATQHMRRPVAVAPLTWQGGAGSEAEATFRTHDPDDQQAQPRAAPVPAILLLDSG